MNQSSVVVGAATLLAVCVLAAAGPAAQRQRRADPRRAAGPRLAPTAHPPVPSDLRALWYAPPKNTALAPALADFVRACACWTKRTSPSGAAAASSRGRWPHAARRLRALLHGRALLALGRYDEAESGVCRPGAAAIDGHLPRMRRWDRPRRWKRGTTSPAPSASTSASWNASSSRRTWRCGGSALAAQRAGDEARAVAAYRRVYFEFPLVAEAEEAETR